MRTPVSPQEWYETGVLLRKQERFGEAINAFARAAELASDEKIRAAAIASIDLIHEITSFANTDLMNP